MKCWTEISLFSSHNPPEQFIYRLNLDLQYNDYFVLLLGVVQFWDIDTLIFISLHSVPFSCHCLLTPAGVWFLNRASWSVSVTRKDGQRFSPREKTVSLKQCNIWCWCRSEGNIFTWFGEGERNRWMKWLSSLSALFCLRLHAGVKWASKDQGGFVILPTPAEQYVCIICLHWHWNWSRKTDMQFEYIIFCHV